MEMRPRRQQSLCSVCARESHDHSGWFLVVENQWFDRLKVLCWHPLLAQQSHIRSACGKLHLKVLINHWLMHSNLQYLSTEPVTTLEPEFEEPVFAVTSDGRLLGELAVHRESLTNLWTGSPESLESILDALIDGLGERENENRVADTVTARMIVELQSLVGERVLQD